MRCSSLTAILSLALALGSTQSIAAATKPSAKASATAGRQKPGGKGAGAKKKAVTKHHLAKAKPKKKVFLEKHVAATRGGLPNVQAVGAYVIDMDTGKELFSRNPDRERPIASISKLAAVLVAIDRGLELDGLTTIAKPDIEAARGGAPSRLAEGATLSNRDLLHAALMGSDNRAVAALGRAVGLSPSKFAAAMTSKAKDLGLRNTRFREPTGLSPENVSTPREVIVMLREVMKNPVLAPIARRIEYDAHPVGRPAVKYIHTSRPALRSHLQLMGAKTGYNDVARYCLTIAVKVDGHSYAMSFLGTEGKLTRFGDVARVADWLVATKPSAKSSAVAASSEKPGSPAPASPAQPPAPASATR